MNRFASLTLALALLSTVTAFGAGTTTWNADPIHSSATFTATHFAISHVTGTIPIKSATVVLPDGSDIPQSARADLDPAALDTHNGMRDSDLRSAHFFEVTTYPAMSFASTKITATDATHFTLEGDLTMHGQTHPITLNAQYLGRAPVMGKERIAYTAKATIDRRQWGMTYGNPVASNSIDLEIDIEAIKQ